MVALLMTMTTAMLVVICTGDASAPLMTVDIRVLPVDPSVGSGDQAVLWCGLHDQQCYSIIGPLITIGNSNIPETLVLSGCRNWLLYLTL